MMGEDSGEVLKQHSYRRLWRLIEKQRLCEAAANSCFFYVLVLHLLPQIYVQTPRKERQKHVQPGLNKMKPNADCIPQCWIRAIGYGVAARSQLFVPRKEWKTDAT